MTRLIDANVLIGDVEQNTDISQFMITYIRGLIREQPTIEDAVPLDGSFLKMSKGSYVIYQREWLYEHLEQEFNILKSASGKPTADAEPVRHGKWANDAMGVLRCSECNAQAPWRFIGIMYDAVDYRWKANYCPQCGARMDQ